MQYKTIVLQYLRQRPALHNQLKNSRTLLPTLDRWASELKSSHEAWTEQLSETGPGDDPSQIASLAMELALQEWMSSLPPDESLTEDELSLDGAMAYIRSQTPPA